MTFASAQMQGQPVSRMGFGVVQLYPGQQEKYCGVQACLAFSNMLINALDPYRFSKVAFSGAAAGGTGVTILAQSRVAFANNVGDTAEANTGYPFALTKAETDYDESENPVPQNCNYLFCAVGLTAAMERPFEILVDSAPTAPLDYPNWISTTADYRETGKEVIYDNTWLSISYGNNGCTYDIGLAKHFPTPNSPMGGDTLSPGRIAMPLVWTPFNAVVCIDSLRNNRKAVLNATLEHDFLIDETSAHIATDGTVYFPMEFALPGFVIQTPGCDALFSAMVAG